MDSALWRLGMFTYWVSIFVPGFSSPVVGPTTAIGHLGESLSVQCSYSEEYRHFDKYWCHGWSSFCSVLVTSTEQQRRVSEGRISISDDPTRLSFTVTMTGLSEEDAGWYQCGISITGSDPLHTVRVTVLPATTIKTTKSSQPTTHQDSTAFSVGWIIAENTVNTVSVSPTSPAINISAAGQFSSRWTLTRLVISSVLLLLLIALATAHFITGKRRQRQTTKSEAHNGEMTFLDPDSTVKAEMT